MSCGGRQLWGVDVGVGVGGRWTESLSCVETWCPMARQLSLAGSQEALKIPQDAQLRETLLLVLSSYIQLSTPLGYGQHEYTHAGTVREGRKGLRRLGGPAVAPKTFPASSPPIRLPRASGAHSAVSPHPVVVKHKTKALSYSAIVEAKLWF